MENAYGQLRTPTKQGCLEYCYTHEKWKHLDQEPSTDLQDGNDDFVWEYGSEYSHLFSHLNMLLFD